MKFPDLAYELGLVEHSRKAKKQAIARLLHYYPRRPADGWSYRRGFPEFRPRFQVDNLERNAVDHALWAFSMDPLAEACGMDFKELTKRLGQPGPYSVRRFW